VRLNANRIRSQNKGEEMANCVFCGEPAGFLRKSHKDCKQLHEQGKSEILSLVDKAGSQARDIKRLESSIEQVAKNSYIDEQTLNALVISGWERAVEAAFDDGVSLRRKKRLCVN
jgi:hypothetical protein